jgi:hypothetical protein
VNVTANQVVYIRVAAITDTQPQYPAPLRYTYAFTAPAPPNDACANAIALADGLTFCTAGATVSPEGVVTCRANPSMGDVWFRYTAPCTGTATINLCSARFDAHVTVFSGNNCNSLGTVLACNDDSLTCDSPGTIATFAAVAGRTYFVRVGGGDYGGGGGRATVSVSCVPEGNTSGACCMGANCSIRPAPDCGGAFLGFGTVCSPGVCCSADVNQSGVLSVQDIFDYLVIFFGNDPRADVNNSGSLSVQDLFDYLSLYFTGC